MELNTLQKIEAIITEAENMKGAYFWNSPSHAKGRRAYEKEHSHPEVAWTDGKDTYTAEYVVSCSCRNIYTQGIYTKNGKKTTLRAIKNSFNRLTTVA